MNFTSRFTSQKSKGDVLDSKQRTRVHGKEMWNVLHTFANFLPERPSNDEIETFSSFAKGILLFGTKFDSSWHDLTLKYITENPFDFTTRDNSMMWMCNFHNYVNVQLEKDLFECNKENLAKRWGNINNIQTKQNNVTL